MSIRVTGTGQGLSRTTNLPNHNSAYTMMAWVNMTSVSGASGTYRALFDIDAGANLGDVLYMTGDGSIASLWVNNGTNFNGSTNISTANWYHVTMVRETNARLLMYIDGKLDATNTTSVSGRAATTQFGIAQALSTSSGEDLQSAQFEDFRVWNRALTQQEIVREMRSVYPVSRGGLVAQVIAETPDHVNDYSGNGRMTVTGTLSVGQTIGSYLPWPRRRRVMYTAAGGDVTLALTGQALASALGTLVPNLSLALTGQAAASAAGTLVPGTSKTLTGSALASSAGTLIPAATVLLVGSALALSAGTLVPALSLALSGQALTGSLGTLVPALSVPLSGLLITIGQGNLSAPGNVTVALTGIALAASQGALVPSTSKALAGSALSIGLGTLIPGTSPTLTGSAVTSAQGSIGPTLTVAMVGSFITASSGTLSVLDQTADPTPATIRRVTVRVATSVTVNAPEGVTVKGPTGVTVH